MTQPQHTVQARKEKENENAPTEQRWHTRRKRRERRDRATEPNICTTLCTAPSQEQRCDMCSETCVESVVLRSQQQTASIRRIQARTGEDGRRKPQTASVSRSKPQTDADCKPQTVAGTAADSGREQQPKTAAIPVRTVASRGRPAGCGRRHRRMLHLDTKTEGAQRRTAKASADNHRQPQTAAESSGRQLPTAPDRHGATKSRTRPRTAIGRQQNGRSELQAAEHRCIHAKQPRAPVDSLKQKDTGAHSGQRSRAACFSSRQAQAAAEMRMQAANTQRWLREAAVSREPSPAACGGRQQQIDARSRRHTTPAADSGAQGADSQEQRKTAAE